MSSPQRGTVVQGGGFRVHPVSFLQPSLHTVQGGTLELTTMPRIQRSGSVKLETVRLGRLYSSRPSEACAADLSPWNTDPRFMNGTCMMLLLRLALLHRYTWLQRPRAYPSGLLPLLIALAASQALHKSGPIFGIDEPALVWGDRPRKDVHESTSLLQTESAKISERSFVNQSHRSRRARCQQYRCPMKN